MMDAKRWQAKLADVPPSPGVYYHLNAGGQIIYVGKAVNLRRRISAYNPQKPVDNLKDRRLRQQIADFKWTKTANGFEALLLEGEMIRRYSPKFNVLQRDALDGGWFYLVFDYQKTNPHLRVVRSSDQLESGDCLGPYLNGRLLKNILKILRKNFPYATHRRVPKKPCLDAHLGLCPCPIEPDFDAALAVANLKKLKLYMAGSHDDLSRHLQREMRQYANRQHYEAAAVVRNQWQALADFEPSLIFSPPPTLSSGDDQALADLRELLNLSVDLERVEAFDISHLSGSQVVGAMVVAQAGVIMPHLKRRFRAVADKNDDTAQMKAVIARRLQSLKAGRLPDLMVVDGGRGQVSAARAAISEISSDIPVIGLAKKEEEIICYQSDFTINQGKLRYLRGRQKISAHFIQIALPRRTALLQFLQRLRDASHSFALSYQRSLRHKQLDSPLLQLPGIGPLTYRRLMKCFGSTRRLQVASVSELQSVVGLHRARIIYDYFHPAKMARN